MGCSYDPVPPVPTEGEIFLTTNHFYYSKWDNPYVTCEKCGVLVEGSPNGLRWVKIHIIFCPGRQ